MLALFRMFSRWPLPVLHALGTAAGWLAYLCSATYRRRFRAHTAQAGYTLAQVRAAIGAAGQMSLELPRLWWGRPVPVQWQGEAAIGQALAAGRGIVFLTPHLGCFEITAQAYAAAYGQGAQGCPMTVLYRPARQPWLREVLQQARTRPGLLTAPATLAGVKQLLKALKRGQAVGLLPDQVPPQGLGQWLPFFGKPAYTMTLSVRLAQQSGATVLLAWGERLPRGQGYLIHVRGLQQALAPDLSTACGQINAEMERLIRQCPGQYLWGYARYKSPRPWEAVPEAAAGAIQPTLPGRAD